MAVNWRGWRPIVVNGERFRWQNLFGSACPCGCGYTFAPDGLVHLIRVRSEAIPSRLLTVRGSWHHLGIILPGDVAEWIAHAQAHGWPNEPHTLTLRLTNQPGVPELAVVG